MKALERLFEGVLWNSRLLVIVAVIASIVGAILMFYIASVDTVYLVQDATHYAGSDAYVRAKEHAKIVAHVAAIIDGYLFAAIMIIFSLGLYELFIGRIVAAETSEVAPRLLLIHTLDDLKDRLAKVVFLILIVRYFEYALQSDIGGPLDLLYLAIGIALVALSLYLTSKNGHNGSASENP